jgi:division protein CdvB (Snf7/Vps24/ESCRT-III family)
MFSLSKYISSLKELDDVCSEILDNISMFEDVSEFLKSLHVTSTGDLIAKILLASYATDVDVGECESCGEEEVEEEEFEVSEDVRRLADEIELNLKYSSSKLPNCMKLKEVVESVKRKR